MKIAFEVEEFKAEFTAYNYSDLMAALAESFSVANKLYGNKVEEGEESLDQSVEWITYKQATEILSVCKGTISRWAKQGKLKSNNSHNRFKRKISKESVALLKIERDSRQKKFKQ